MAGVGPQSTERRQAWFGPAYVAKIAAQAGYAWQATAAENDVHSFDGFVAIHPGTELSVQVKCYRGQFKKSKSYKILPAWRDNWATLVQPAYFVVVEVPENVSAWLEHDVNARSTLERASAYWTRIDPLLDGQKSIQVRTDQRLTAATFELWHEQFVEYAEALGLMVKGESR